MRQAWAGVAMALGLGMSMSALAALPDEFTVYTDDIARPGETELEAHLNTTPSGIAVPAYPGEVVSSHGWRLTPEISHGLGDGWAVGLYLPTVWSQGTAYVAGARAKLTWIPLKVEDTTSGAFFGLSAEVSQIQYRFEPDNRIALMAIAGIEGAGWQLAVNPVLSVPRSQIGQPAQAGLAARLMRDLEDDWRFGAEYYSQPGQAKSPLPWAQQANILFAVAEYGGRPFKLNVGLGRGMTPASDRWTVKSIVEIPL